LPIDAFDQFNRKYGEPLPDGQWEVPAPWQAGLSNVSARYYEY
jgi:SP family general alpha glucoside:H+ symporter-like MFS transporter